MLLSEVFEQLSKGELRQLAVANSSSSVKESDQVNYLVPHVNLALSALHRRFPLRTSDLYIELQDGQTEYVIHHRYAESNINSMEPVKYIKDLNKPFKDNMMKIDQIFNMANEPIPLNDSADPNSISTTNYNTLVVPYPKQGELLRIRYRADHPKLTNDDLDAENVEIDLPWTFLEPLVYHISSRLHASTPNMTHESEQPVYIQLFEKACQEIEAKNILHREQTVTDSFTENGWV